MTTAATGAEPAADFETPEREFEMLEKFWNALAGKHRERDQARIASYRDLCESLADGKAVDVAKSLDVCEAVGKTPADLRGDVDLILQRREWRELAGRAPALLEENNRLATELGATKDRHRAEFEALRQRHHAEIIALDQALSRCTAARNESDNARVKLQETGERYQEICDLQRQAGDAMRRVQQSGSYELTFRRSIAEGELRAAQKRLEQASQRIARDPAIAAYGVPNSLRDERERAQAAVAAAEAKLQPIVDEIEHLAGTASGLYRQVTEIESAELAGV